MLTAKIHSTTSASTSNRKHRPPRVRECSICQRRFKRSEHLTRHFRRHTQEKPYQCRICLACFARKELHDRHQQRQHGAARTEMSLPNILEGNSRFQLADSFPAGGGNGENDHSLPLQSPDPQQNSIVSSHESNPAVDLPSLFESATLDHVQLDEQHPNYDPAVFHTSSGPLRAWESHDSLLGFGGVGNSIPTSASIPESSLEQLGRLCTEIQYSLGDNPRPNFPPQETHVVGSSMANGDNALPTRQSAVADSSSHSMKPWDSVPLSPNVDFFSISGFPPWIVSAVPSRAPSPSCSTNRPSGLAMRSITMSDQSLAHISIPSSPSELQVIDQMRNILMQSLTQLRTSDSSQLSFVQSFQVPDIATLDRYQKMFFAMPNKNLPFTHESLPILENAPAFNLAILADGAMYCGDYSSGIWLFEASRRLVEDYLEKINSNNIPLWLLNTLLANSVFGLPGGDEESPKVTIGSLQSLIYLASRVSESPLPVSPMLDHEDYQWRDFISKESKKRSLLCVLVMTGLWSAAYGPIQISTSPFFDQIELPCAEILWTATSAEQWQGLSSTTRPPGKLREVVLRLLDGSYYACSGLASLCIVVGLLLYMDELRIEASGDLSGFRSHLVTAINRWGDSHSPDRRENNSINFIAFPAAAYLRVSLEVNIRFAMSAFLEHDFSPMRDVLRDGDLRKAGIEALSGLVPWASCHKNQISMVAIPLALVVSESVLLLATQPSLLEDAESSPLKQYGDVLALEDHEVNTVGIWQVLRSIISNGPVTLVLLTALEAYGAELEQLQAPQPADILPGNGG